MNESFIMNFQQKQSCDHSEVAHCGLHTHPKRTVQMDDTKRPITSMNLAPI